jgi:hypothetical protein
MATVNALAKPDTKEDAIASVSTSTKAAQIRVAQRSPA